MKTTFLCLVLVGAVSCTTLLKNPPRNADINYIYENNKLVEVEIDYKNDPRPVIKTIAPPVPTVKKVVPIAAPVKKSGASKTYYKIDDGELERVKPTHVGYSVLPEAPVVPVVKSVHVAPAPAPAPAPATVPAPAPVVVKAAPEPLTIAGPQVVLKQAPAPTARSVIIKGPQVIYKRTGPAPIAAPALAPAPAPAPVVMVKSAPATPAPVSPLIKTFWKQDDGELEKITPTHVSYSLVKSAPAPVPVGPPVNVVPVAAPVFPSPPSPSPAMYEDMYEDESIEDEED